VSCSAGVAGSRLRACARSRSRPLGAASEIKAPVSARSLTPWMPSEQVKGRWRSPSPTSPRADISPRMSAMRPCWHVGSTRGAIARRLDGASRGSCPGSPRNGLSAACGQLGHSLEPRSGSRIRRGASVPAWTARLQQSQASDAPLPHFIKLTIVERDRQGDTARVPVEARRNCGRAAGAGGAHLRALTGSGPCRWPGLHCRSADLGRTPLRKTGETTHRAGRALDAGQVGPHVHNREGGRSCHRRGQP
jgi:hypothetical protein